MKKIRIIIAVLFLVAAGVLLYLAYSQMKVYDEGNQEYEDLKEDVDVKGNGKEFSLDWEALWKKNKDIIAWIRMDSGADYPILYCGNNTYYLHKGPDREYNINGSIFMNGDNHKDWSDPNTVIYGHNMNNGSMFGSNRKYKEADYLKKHPTFEIYRPDGKYTYRIFSVLVAYDATYPYTVQFDTKEEYQNYLNKVKGDGLYNTKVMIPDLRKIVTLSTCTSNGHKRLLIQGYIDSVDDYKGMIAERGHTSLKNNAFAEPVKDEEYHDTEDIEILQ